MNAQSKEFKAQTTGAPSAVETPEPRKGKRRALMLSVPVALAAGATAFWLFGGRYIETDNAYVHQTMVTVSPEVSGRVTEVLVSENQSVTAGTPLFLLDPTDYRIALDTAEANLAQARLAIEEKQAAYRTAQAQLQAAQEIETIKARELKRQASLAGKGLGSQSTLDTAEIAEQSATNEVELAQRQLAASLVALGGNPDGEIDSMPSVRAALAQRDAAARHLEQTEVHAPGNGIVAQVESLNVGQYIGAGTGIATLVRQDASWIEANFKETQLDMIHPGLPVEIEVDAYPGLELSGTVDSFGPATGSQFSLIPAQNATGNWVKVVQRVPIRVRLDQNPERPLLDGMSVAVSVDTGASRLQRLQ